MLGPVVPALWVMGPVVFLMWVQQDELCRGWGVWAVPHPHRAQW